MKLTNFKQFAALVVATLAMVSSVPGFIGSRSYAQTPTVQSTSVCGGTTRYVQATYPPSFYAYYPAIADRANRWPCYLQGDSRRRAAVVLIQNAMRRCYNQDIVVDGIYGFQTQIAVNNVRAWHHMPAGRFELELAMDYMRWPLYRYSDGRFLGCEWTPVRGMRMG